tara:strand:- start:87 stop:941 length:855 start_codon:yes stop_codon:yes gene_type:complete
MSDSTIEDAFELLGIGKGDPDKLKQIISSLANRSMISMQDRKYVEALVEQYLTPRHKQKSFKTNDETITKTNFPRIRKINETAFKITDVKTTSENISKSTESKKAEPRKVEFASKEATIEEKFIEHIETDRTESKKSGKGKIISIIIGVVAVIAIGGGAVYMGGDLDLSSSNTEIERLTCQDEILLVSSTKVPNFPAPGKDLQHYLDRYENEPKYREWFDKNFSGQTIKEVLVPQMGEKETKIPGFPDPGKDLQHYLDRYENEPKYREWFDKNFPGQTIKEAVC